MSISSIDIIDRQAKLLKLSVGALARRDQPYALLDFPNHSNVGDSAIWLGEVELLKSIYGRIPDYVCTFDSFDADAFLKDVPHGTIFLHGGGNFGDIYPWYQRFREKIIASFPDHRIVQLPQTIKFHEMDGVKASSAIISAHNDFHLMVRDRPSEAFAREHFSSKVSLVPDSAFYLGSFKRASAPVYETLFLLRTDDEKVSWALDNLNGQRNLFTDWIEEPADVGRRCHRHALMRSLLTLKWRSSARRLEDYQALAWHRVKRGLAMLSGAQQVVTDRLHAHILSLLLDKPHIALDNNYGKIANYRDAWTSDYEFMLSASSIEDIPGKIMELKKIVHAGPAAGRH